VASLSTSRVLSSLDGAVGPRPPMPTCTFAMHRAAIVDIVVHGAECVLSFDSGRVACLESAHCAERGRRGTVVTGDIGGTVTLPR
jgi:hypothetical protein